MKKSCVTLRIYSGSGLGSGDGESDLAFVVGRRFFKSCFICPFWVAVESGKCLEIGSSFSPGEVVRWLFFIVWIYVEDAGLKNAA